MAISPLMHVSVSESTFHLLPSLRVRCNTICARKRRMAVDRHGIASLLLLLFLILLCANTATATPTFALPVARGITVNNATGTVQIFDKNGNLVKQGDATDGSGSNFDLPALIWIGFSLAIGAFMSIAGIRGWRVTTGAAIGLSSAVLTFAAIINSVNETGLGDIFLTAIVLVIFALGFGIGVFEFARLGGITAVGLAGGAAFGLRIVLLQEGLLISSTQLYALNWLIVGVCAGAAGLSLIWFQRFGLLFGCASIGTFLLGLGVDLFMQKQAGLSLGLRFLFDRNDSHALFFIEHPYTAPLRSRVVLYTSLALTPILALIQHRVFRDPFTRRPVESDDALAINFPTDGVEPEKRKTFFLAMWDGVRREPEKVNRFSV
ncbi:SET domain-containing protein [Mycena kentingensis (nom. inval.)]|nr:SET domain-containing protein [Mycena kentingensis (nom. inval.)]